ncbi:MAG: chemotaxis protein CheC [Clostridiales bacterium]|nr:chemotaxis protein CheC [Clostridiales bacterium]
MLVKNLPIDENIIATLTELGNVGVGKATNSLSKMLGFTLNIDIPDVTLANIDDIKNNLNFSKLNAVGVSVPFENDIQGTLFFILEQDFAAEIIRSLVDDEYSGEMFNFNEEISSLIQEIANMMAASYLSAISKYTDMRVFTSSQTLYLNNPDVLLTYQIKELPDDEHTICVSSKFSATNNGKNFDGYVLFLPKDQSIEKIMKILGIE